MLPRQEIDYEALIDGAIRDFQPAQRLWSVGARMLGWIVFEAAILSLAAWVGGHPDLRALFHGSDRLVAVCLFISASIPAAFVALKSAIPGREASLPENLGFHASGMDENRQPTGA